MSWQEFADDDEEYEDETPALTFGDVRAGERTAVQIDAEPETFESEDYGEGVRIEATFGSSEHDFDGIEEGDDVVIVTWSSRLVRSLAVYDDDHDGIVGDVVHITKYGSGYDVEYEVEPGADADE